MIFPDKVATLEVTKPSETQNTPPPEAIEPDSVDPIEVAPPEPEIIPLPKDKAAKVETGKAVVGAEGAEAPYTPNIKFRAMKEEKEFEDWAKTLVNKDNEKGFRELHEKAYALEPIKVERDTLRQENYKVKQEFQDFYGDVQRLGDLKNKDLEMFLEELKVPPTDVIKLVKEWLELKEMPEEQRRVYEERKSLRRENLMLQAETSNTSQSANDVAVQAKAAELNRTLSEPNVQAAVEQYESRIGRPGAFADFVIRYAATEFDRTKGQKHLSADEAVNDVLKMLNLEVAQPSVQVQPPSQGGTPNVQATTQKPTVIPAVKPTVIPNVGSGTSAPSVTRPKSIADLRAMAKAANG